MNRGKKTVLISAFFFAASALIFWFVFGIVSPPVKYVSVAAEMETAAPFDLVRFATRRAFGCTVEALAVFLSGLSFFPCVTSSAVLAFRGASFGAAIRGIREGVVLIQGTTAIPGLDSKIAVLALYALSSLLFIAFSFVAASFSEKFRTGGAGRVRTFFVYTAVFTVFLGAVTALDLLRCAAVN
ncbi:MAG: hypothetical protein IJM71_04550 [Clostridia bacterium]|nr:hypothetical protein [Clostridia bacterium]